MTDKQKQTRLDELHRGALATYADKGDFNVWDWLTEKETEEYENLLIETGQASREDFN